MSGSMLESLAYDVHPTTYRLSLTDTAYFWCLYLIWHLMRFHQLGWPFPSQNSRYNEQFHCSTHHWWWRWVVKCSSRHPRHSRFFLLWLYCYTPRTSLLYRIYHASGGFHYHLMDSQMQFLSTVWLFLQEQYSWRSTHHQSRHTGCLLAMLVHFFL